MTVWEELLSVYKVKPTITNIQELNSFLIEATDWIADANNVSDEKWDSLSIDLQKYVNECIAIMDSVQLKDVKLEAPNGFTLSIPATEKENVKKEIKTRKVTPIKKEVKTSRKTCKKSNADVGFERVLKCLWDNPYISKNEFLSQFPDEKPSSLILYRNVLSRAFKIVKEDYIGERRHDDRRVDDRIK